MSLNEKAAILNVGSGLTFIELHELWSHFAPTGLTYRQFKAWVGYMRVPLLIIKGACYVRLTAFRTALVAISSVGQEDFYVGCAAVEFPEEEGPHPPHEKRRTEVPKNFYDNNKEELLLELLFLRGALGRQLNRQDIQDCTEAIRYFGDYVATRALVAQRTKEIKAARLTLAKEVGTVPSDGIASPQTV